MTNNTETTTEYAVATRTFTDGPFDRIDTGANWSSRTRGYTYHEAVVLVRRENGNERRRTGNPAAVGAILMTRTVTAWKPLEKEA